MPLVRPRQKRIALFIALVADVVQIALAPVFFEGGLSPFDAALDALVAVALVVTLGWRWRTALALVLELAPGLALFPTWTLFVATLAHREEEANAETRHPQSSGSTQLQRSAA
jgi:hypothetical protein